MLVLQLGPLRHMLHPHLSKNCVESGCPCFGLEVGPDELPEDPLPDAIVQEAAAMDSMITEWKLETFSLEVQQA